MRIRSNWITFFWLHYLPPSGPTLHTVFLSDIINLAAGLWLQYILYSFFWWASIALLMKMWFTCSILFTTMQSLLHVDVGLVQHIIHPCGIASRLCRLRVWEWLTRLTLCQRAWARAHRVAPKQPPHGSVPPPTHTSPTNTAWRDTRTPPTHVPSVPSNMAPVPSCATAEKKS